MRRIAPMTALLVGALALPALAHHILGVPHYAYDEAYPQAPVITYRVEAGGYLVRLTGYPGKPSAGELGEVRAYIHRIGDESDVFAGPVAARLERDGLLGSDLVWGPTTTRFEENLHKLSPRYGDDGHYRIRLELELEDRPYEIDFPIEVGRPTSSTALLLGWGGGILFVVLVLRAVRIKLERRRAGGRVAGVGA